MGHGNPPTQKAIDIGIRPSLSVDVETSVPNDFFTQMRTVFSLQKNEVWARRLAGDKNPPKFLTVAKRSGSPPSKEHAPTGSSARSAR